MTKSGKNRFQGGFYGFVRDDRFDARNFLTGQKDALDFHNVGWTFSGPIGWPGFNSGRSKLFFFVAQEWKSLDSQVALTRTNTTPSLLERQGNFSQSPRVPVDPLTGQPFPGGIIPADRLSANGVALVARFPLPDAGSRNNVTLTPTQVRDIREDIVKLDARPQPSSNLSVRLIRDRVEQTEPYGSFGGTSGYSLVPTAIVVSLRESHEGTVPVVMLGDLPGRRGRPGVGRSSVMFVAAVDTLAEEVEPGVARQVLGHDPHLMMVRVTFRAGAVSALHSHPHRQVTYVERGRFETTIGDQTRLLAAGDCFFVTPGVRHGVAALEDGVLIDAFTPAREEFLR